MSCILYKAGQQTSSLLFKTKLKLCFQRPLAFSDVPNDALKVSWISLIVAHQLKVDLHINETAIFAPRAAFKGGNMAARLKVLSEGEHRLLEFYWRYGVKGHVFQLFYRIPCHFSGSAIGAFDPIMKIKNDDGIVGLLKQGSILDFFFA